jgi:nicotinamide-nucleotide adenylyltransferase
MRARYGMIHGRFQPFHCGHLQYALAALARCDHLIVGITNPDPSLIVAEAADPERHRPAANPFTFFERQRMIRAALAEAGAAAARLSLVPFPIHHPERWQFYCPRETTQFVRIFSAWGEEKADRLRAMGWRVEVLDAGAAKRVSGSEVRRRLREGSGWEGLVPSAVANVLREIGAAERLGPERNDGGENS